MTSEQKLTRILAERPKFHEGELEIMRTFEPSESFLPAASASKIASSGPVFYGIGEAATRFIFESVSSQSKTLEVGLGMTTLAFTLKGAQHVCITPFQSEIDAIRTYGRTLDIDFANTQFVCESSDTYLPRCDHADLDLVLIDGKHAFPFPMLDWYFTADRLKRSGIMIIDDVHIKPVRIVKEFLDSDPRWQLISGFDHKSFAYRKLTDTVHDVAWHMQPYAFQGMNAQRLKKISSRAIDLVRNGLSRNK